MGLANPAPGNATFIQKRRDATTVFMRDAAADIYAIKPWVIIAGAPIVYSSTLNSTYNSVFQYYPDWNGSV